MIKFANIQEIAIEFVYCRQQKIITFYLTDDNSKSWVEVIIVTFLDVKTTVDVLTANDNDEELGKL